MLLHKLYFEARENERQVEQIRENAVVHGNALCDLVENYMDSCDEGDIEKASDILDKVGKALDMTNKMSDGDQRTKHVQRINDLLSNVRDLIKGMVDQVKVKQEEEEDDLDTFLDQFLSQLEDMVAGDEEPAMDDPMMDMPMGDEGDCDMGGDDMEGGDEMLAPAPEENEEGCSYRGRARRTMRESQQKLTLRQYIVESLKEEEE